MAGHARAATGEIGAGLMGALLAVDGAVRAAREQAAW
ncbi:hypothetical protein MetexDRAFT_6716, partial [Methylorubrum extorquens DSM 13060]